MKLIDDWKQSWKFLSVQLNAVAATFVVVFMTLSKDDQTSLLSLLPFGEHNAAVLVLVLVIVQTWARLKAQPKLHE